MSFKLYINYLKLFWNCSNFNNDFFLQILRYWFPWKFLFLTLRMVWKCSISLILMAQIFLLTSTYFHQRFTKKRPKQTGSGRSTWTPNLLHNFISLDHTLWNSIKCEKIFWEHNIPRRSQTDIFFFQMTSHLISTKCVYIML